MMIDSGSCTDVVAKEMVTKLNLKIEPHAQPYKIQWFQKGNDLKVIKKCLVWCDVVSMDACHLLLGRP